MAEDKKIWWHSKEIWTSLIAFAVLLIQEKTGYIVPLQLQGYFLIVVYFVLRWFTHKQIVWKMPEGLDISKVIIVILCLGLLVGCANALTKTCRELTKAHDFMIQAEVVAKAGHEKDPNIVTEEHLIQLEIMKETIQHLQVLTCNLSDILPDK